MSHYLTGVYNITPTPFHPDGSLDEASLRQLTTFTRGAIGTMTGFAFPVVFVEIHRRFMAADVDGAARVFFQNLPLIRFENQAGIYLTLRKHIYQRRGVIASARVRAPFGAVDAATLQDLDELLRRLNLPVKGQPAEANATLQ